MRNAAHRLETLRRHRQRREPHWAISTAVAEIARQAQRHDKRLGELNDLWRELLPRAIAAQTRLSGLRGGVLAVTAATASVSYELDRLLRSGLEAQLRAAARTTIIRIRLSVGQVEEDEPQRRGGAEKSNGRMKG